MKLITLSAFPYYGGKARMASLISEMLDYNSTDVYIEPFGGACRVLLNKPRHKYEIYNDSSWGLSAFFNLMSKYDTAEELIDRLYETEYSKECFDEALEYRNRVDDPLELQTRHETMRYQRQLLVNYNIISKNDNYATFLKRLKSLDKSFVSKLTPQEVERVKLLGGNYIAAKKIEDEDCYIDLPEGWLSFNEAHLMDDFKLAVSTFVIYSQSRDAMGTYWNPLKYNTPEAYYRQIDKLREVANRLNGVKVEVPRNALLFLHSYFGWAHENVMMYLDPSYLKPEDEKQYKARAVKLKNLGSSYKQSFSYENHEELLKIICDAKCKILISNYDVDLYNQYLKAPKWKRIEFDTKTSVGGIRDNKRTEVLWYNY